MLSTYLYARITTDSRDDDAAARTVEMQTRTAPLGPLAKRLGSWLDALGVDEFVARSSVAAEHEFMLRKAAEGAELQMSEAEESPAPELASSGSLAWQRLHGDVSSQLMVDVQGEQVPMAMARTSRCTPTQRSAPRMRVSCGLGDRVGAARRRAQRREG
jgi:oligoendopeptidase F